MERTGKPINMARGFGIIECLISILLLTFLLVGGMSFYIYSNEHLKLATYKRIAADLANSEIERRKQAGYAEVLPACPDPSPDTTQKIGFLPATVSACAPAPYVLNDGCAGCGNYKPIKVTVQWTQPGQSILSQVTLDSFIAEEE